MSTAKQPKIKYPTFNRVLKLLRRKRIKPQTFPYLFDESSEIPFRFLLGDGLIIQVAKCAASKEEIGSMAPSGISLDIIAPIEYNEYKLKYIAFWLQGTFQLDVIPFECGENTKGYYLFTPKRQGRDKMSFNFNEAFEREYPYLDRIYFAKERSKKPLDDKCLRSACSNCEKWCGQEHDYINCKKCPVLKLFLMYSDLHFKSSW